MAYSQRIETAIFDMDGLLIDSGTAVAAGRAGCLRRTGSGSRPIATNCRTPWLRIDLVVPGDAVARGFAR